MTLLIAGEVADVLKVSETTVPKLIERDEIPAVRMDTEDIAQVRRLGTWWIKTDCDE
jgi:orotate phosphoribosyltransferase-like protein